MRPAQASHKRAELPAGKTLNPKSGLGILRATADDNMDSPRGRRPTCKQLPIEARYANYFEVGHNAYEFMVDFGQYQPPGEQVQMQTRIVTGPVFAKLLSRLLSQALEQFELEYGIIEEASDDLDPLEMVKQSINGYDRGPTRLQWRQSYGGASNKEILMPSQIRPTRLEVSDRFPMLGFTI